MRILIIFATIAGSVFLYTHHGDFISAENLAGDIGEKCKSSNGCIVEELRGVVHSQGPKKAVDVINEIQRRGLLSAGTDPHQFGHEIGHETARSFGISGEAFSMCPIDINYACQHGFFEFALGKGLIPTQAANSICSGLELSSKEKLDYSDYYNPVNYTIYTCYHGIGHGLLMATEYNLTKAMRMCDYIISSLGRDGCKDGVRMENLVSHRAR